LVIGVVGGSGGLGSSTFAAAIASAGAPSVLVDLDPVGGGIDVLLDIEGLPGARWSQMQLDGGYLDPVLLRDGLPRWQSVAVLAADAGPASPAAVAQVVAAAAEIGPVVLDLPRAPSRVRAAVTCTFTVLLAEAQVRELAAARAVLASLGDGPTGVVLRRGAVPVDDAAARLGVPLLGVLPPLDRTGNPRAAARLAAGVLDGLDR
jgi:Mrp family chromosome partitioning ATPase